ncbi:peptidase S9 [Lysobacter xinjiangensis]|uniref:Peptidase S9 n=1 Tax=Cognatilysobacter xinjiangensis TaxID=546892 RepID=A0ABQ3BT17_9GAMM|nr:S9 family peptidase [Lysobacter xinjiangensis]GGZ54267.1 peptidase S9 [Lysobacter xinjiangensis]
MNRFRIAVIAAVMAASPLAHALDIEPYIRKDKFEQIKISPKGDYFAATVPMEDRTILAVIRRSDNKVTGSFSLGRNTTVVGFNWVNPERVLISVGEKFGALDEPSPTGELFALNATSGQADPLVGYRVRQELGTHIKGKKAEDVAAFLVDDLANDDKSVIITVSPFATDTFARAEKMDVYSGRRTRVASAPMRNASFTTDNAGIVRFAHGEDIDLSTRLYYRKGDGEPWQVINDAAATGLDEAPLGFSADDRIAYLLLESEKGPDRIIAYDTVSGERREVMRDSVADPMQMIYKPGTNVPIGAYFAAGKPEMRFFDETSPDAKLYRLLEKSFEGSTVSITSETADGGVALVYVSSDRNSGDYYLFDTRKLKADYVMSNQDWFDPDLMNPSVPVNFKARDGLALRGFVTRPKGSEGKRLPMVVMPHGGPFGIRDYWRFDNDVQMLASAGYAVLQVNYRGSGGYGRDFRYAGARQWGGAMQDDLTDATKWAIEQGIADGSRICLYGASYGGYASLMGVAKEPDLYRCAVGYVGVYDLPTMHTAGDIADRKLGRNYVNDWIGPRDKVAEVSPTRLADRIKVPVFLAAGGEDERAPIEHSRMMERALRKAGVPVETLYFDTEGHGFYLVEHRREFYTKLLAFLSRSLGGETASPPVAGAKTATR